MNTITVVNVKHVSPGSFVYCGRYNSTYNLKASPLANPFKLEIDTDEERVKCLAQYREWLYDNTVMMNTAQYWEIERLADLLESQPLALGCWCKQPSREVACHCDVIADFVRRECARRQAVAAMQREPTVAPTKRSIAGLETVAGEAELGPIF